jgi:PhoPQ-activated pathogenicity-related protein
MNHRRLIFRRRGIVLLGLPLLLATLFCQRSQETVTAKTALESYLQNGDETFSFRVQETDRIEGLDVYSMQLTSQRWRDYTWKHTLTVLDPHENVHDGALLFITGGRNMGGNPVKLESDKYFIQSMGSLAQKNKALVAILWQVPNQPLYDDLYEDALISYTLHNFKNEGDFTWPLLFPMVKSALRAMDAVQEFSAQTLGHKISRFVVTGASKRGWTTWLAGAMDPRIEAMAPMVIDVLNMPVNLDYQVKVWGDYSIQITDYVELGIPQQVHTETGKLINTMIDPYSYRNKLSIPKLILIGTNDEYWPVDAIKHYIDGLPGANYIHYVPNAGHGLGDTKQASAALSAFFGRTMSGKPYPLCDWHITAEENRLALSVETTPSELSGADLWIADSEDRDFRDEEWNSRPIAEIADNPVRTTVDFPESGFRAFYLALRYRDPNGGDYTRSTRMFVGDENGLLTD